jgi:molybdenum cofactor guanylyltransferase
MTRDRAVAAAILAGGLARRMNGANKATLWIGAARIIDRQLAILRQIADPVFIVAGDPAPFAGLGVDVVADAIPGAGALGGIYTAITASPRMRTLVVACDMPFLNRALLERLTEPDEADAVLPRTVAGLEPLCAVYAAACADPIRRRIERGALRAADVVADVRLKEVGPEVVATYDPHGLMFVNVNTPHDYEHALKLIEFGSKPSADRIMEDSENR